MHIFLAGATGVLGRRIVPLLVSAGHEVTAMTRRPDRASGLAAAGAVPVVADALDRDAVVAAVAAARPDVVLNQLTDLAGGIGPANSQLRVTGSANLAEAVRTAGVQRVVAESISWAYGHGEAPAREEEPLDVDASDPRGRTVRAVAALEKATAEAPEWVVLRYGMFYGPDTWFAPEGKRADEARSGTLVADADVTSFVHVDDAARAAVLALGWPSGAVNVCDDEPAAGADWVPAFARYVGAPAPAPAGTPRTRWARGADNAFLRNGLGMVPDHTSWRQEWQAGSS